MASILEVGMQSKMLNRKTTMESIQFQELTLKIPQNQRVGPGHSQTSARRYNDNFTYIKVTL